MSPCASHLESFFFFFFWSSGITLKYIKEGTIKGSWKFTVEENVNVI